MALAGSLPSEIVLKVIHGSLALFALPAKRWFVVAPWYGRYRGSPFLVYSS